MVLNRATKAILLFLCLFLICDRVLVYSFRYQYGPFEEVIDLEWPFVGFFPLRVCVLGIPYIVSNSIPQGKGEVRKIVGMLLSQKSKEIIVFPWPDWSVNIFLFLLLLRFFLRGSIFSYGKIEE